MNNSFLKYVAQCMAVLALTGFVAGCSKEEPAAPADPVAEAEKAAPAPAGEPTLTLYFDPAVADLPPGRRSDATELTPDGRAAVAKLAETAQAEPNKVVLLTPYYDEVANPNNDIAYARQRANTVRNYLSGEGFQEARIFMGPPRVAAKSGNPADAFRVEVRLQ